MTKTKRDGVRGERNRQQKYDRHWGALRTCRCGEIYQSRCSTVPTDGATHQTYRQTMRGWKGDSIERDSCHVLTTTRLVCFPARLRWLWGIGWRHDSSMSSRYSSGMGSDGFPPGGSRACSCEGVRKTAGCCVTGAALGGKGGCGGEGCELIGNRGCVVTVTGPRCIRGPSSRGVYGDAGVRSAGDACVGDCACGFGVVGCHCRGTLALPTGSASPSRGTSTSIRTLTISLPAFAKKARSSLWK